MTTARFKINGTASEPRGYDATPGQGLTFTLEESPANDVRSVLYQVYDAGVPNSPLSSLSAPALVLSPASGIPTTANGNVTTTAPAAAHQGASYIVRCVVDGGIGPDGKVDQTRTYERIVTVRTQHGLRKPIPSESTQYGARGTADELAKIVDAVESYDGAMAKRYPLNPVAAATIATVQGSMTPQLLGVTRIDPAAVAAAGKLTRRCYLCVYLHTTNAAKAANFDLSDLGAGGAQITGSQLTSTAVAPTFQRVEVPDLTALGAAKNLRGRLWISSPDGVESAVCSGAWLEWAWE